MTRATRITGVERPIEGNEPTMPDPLRVTRTTPAASLVASVLAAHSAGLVGVPFTGRARSWYATLRRPVFAPPAGVFGPVWGVLYTSMGVAAWLVARAPDSARRARALELYVTQLALNAAWTPLFFGARRPRLALAEQLALLGTLLATVVAFCRVRRVAGFVMVPYLLWTVFATVLNGAIVRLNPRRGR